MKIFLELFLPLIALVALAAASAYSNRNNNEECVAKGGRVIYRPSELFDSCLLPPEKPASEEVQL